MLPASLVWVTSALSLEPPDGPICGDGQLDPGEYCDDGNNLDGDGCSMDCLPEFAGCCLPDGTCITTVASACAAMGGVDFGPMSACTAPSGCCADDGTCQALDPLCCLAAGGQPLRESCAGDADGDSIDDACVVPPDLPVLSPAGMILLLAVLLLGVVMRTANHRPDRPNHRA